MPGSKSHPVGVSIPNTLGILGEPSIHGKGCLTVAELVAQSSFKPIEKQIILFIISQQIRCECCMEKHAKSITDPALSQKMKQALETHRLLDAPHLDVLQDFLQEMIKNNGQISANKIQAFLKAGYSGKNLMELMTMLEINTISNYSDHLVVGA